MRKITVFNSVSLDGVMQAPGRPDEDRRDEFTHGGWAVGYADPVMASFAGEGMARDGGLLFGRRTYEDFYSVWPNRPDNPFTDVLNRRQKYVASRTLVEPLPWRDSTLLQGDVVDAVARLKQESDGDLLILGSGELIRSLIPRKLIDQFILLIHPLVLGSGRRLFADDGHLQALKLVDSRPTSTGVLIATYQPV